MRETASQRQIEAADPAESVWLSANAGSGKTRVLIDRVARLLLGGAEPQRILCLTYTKAAATEMQNRLFARLGQWAMLRDAPLRKALVDLGVEGGVNAQMLAQARQLFARAIDTPGGLKIQTIHSFCAGLLRRFPIESRVSPAFVELDERSARQIRDEIIDEIAAGPAVGALDAVARLSSDIDLNATSDEICRNSDVFLRFLTAGECRAMMGLAPDFDAASLVHEVFIGGEADLFSAMIPLLRTGGVQDGKLADTFSDLGAFPTHIASLQLLEGKLLYGDKAKAPFAAKVGDIPGKPLREGICAPYMADFEALMRRVEAARPLRLALFAAERTAALHAFASAFLPRYQARKARHGWLDFDDLIRLSAALIANRDVAAWVLYRLDGGIDHILVDEAQDTSPAQWRVIERLAEEFTSGQGARDVARTIFVVGDKKQSIYSFQGADIDAFDRMRHHFAAKYRAVSAAFQPMELEHSFRSSEAILRVVDLTFDERVQRGVGGEMRHIAFHSQLPGRVDLWPLVPKASNPEQEHWFDPKDLQSEDHHVVLLARRIAAEIRRMIDGGVQIPGTDGPRPVDEGDFLILVQRRSEMFHQIIRACKDQGLEIAGADRMKLAGELAVRDLAALLNFLSLPEDDLSLAAVLRSPLFGLSEAALYDIAHPRGKTEFLWAALRRRRTEFPAMLEVLDDLRGQADFLRPYELIERMLVRHEGRQKLIGRLGAEAEDGIDVFLAQALAYEQAHIPSLTGFLAWIDTENVDVKRRPDSARRAIRVMTVHGAKGLEAPIVILPDTATRREDIRSQVIPVGETAIWKSGSDETPDALGHVMENLKRQQSEERMRLLYVAMTRAERWLIVCGAGEPSKDELSWYDLVREGIVKAGAAPTATPDFDGSGILRHESGIWPEPATAAARANPEKDGLALPDWASQRAESPASVERPLLPSALTGAKALAGDAGLDVDHARLRGTVLHRLLELLPLWAKDDWPDLLQAIRNETEGGSTAGLSGDELAELLDSARTVLGSPDMAELRTPDALLEVELTGSVAALGGRIVHGTIDRLIVGPERVLAVDYKSNATVPSTPTEVPEGILRQMGAYAALLEQIYPDRQVETAILWTTTGTLMRLPPDMVRAALSTTPIP
jgi:ATP-dependent helicase/nuclease subunit A